MKKSFLLILLLISGRSWGQFFLDTVEITGTRINNGSELSRQVYKSHLKDFLLSGQNQWGVSLDCPALLVRSRGGSGAVSDININGGMFEQNLVMLEGMRLNDSQTGHFHFDLPGNFFTSPYAQTKVLTGNASSVYGSNALGGVVDFSLGGQTEGVLARMGTGSDNHRSYSADISKDLKGNGVTLSIGRESSDGYDENLDYENYHVFFKDKIQINENISQKFYYYYSSKDFGAQNFYGPYPSYEETRAHFAGGQTKVRINRDLTWTNKLYYKRHKDFFVLNRYDTNPNRYENNHESQTYTGESYLSANSWSAGVFYQDSRLNSSNLDKRTRNNFAAFGEYSYDTKRLHGRAGLRYDIYNKNSVLAPSVGLSYYPSQSLKIFMNSGISFRQPSFTELYYNSPANQGDPDLDPETAYAVEAGFRHQKDRLFNISQSFFFRYEKNSISWIRKHDDKKTYFAVNDGRDVYGSRSSFSINLGKINYRSSLALFDYKKHDDFYPDKKYFRLENQWNNLLIYHINNHFDYSLSYQGVKTNSQNRYWLLTSFLQIKIRDFFLSVRGENLLNDDHEVFNGLQGPGIQWFLSLAWRK